jgi:hypothetical protein
MKTELRRHCGALAVAGGLAAFAVLPVVIQAQTSQGRAVKSSVPRTADGHPDLQGVWDFRTITPLERPDAFGGKETLSDDEVSQVEAQARADAVDRAPRQGDPGTYNQFWFDRGTRVVGDRRTSLIVDPPDGRIPALTPEGQKRKAFGGRRDLPAGPEDRNVAERCILGFNSGPPMEPRAYNNNVQIVQNKQYVAIVNEMVHNVRVVPIDGRPAGTIPQWNGQSRGRWDGDTLVVETSKFYGPTSFSERQGATTDLQLVERFRRLDRQTLLYEFTVTDPKTWTRPWTVSLPMTIAEEPIFEYACHEANYAMEAMLKGARLEEQAAAKK